MEYIKDVLPTLISSAIGYFVWRIQTSRAKQELEMERREKIHTAEVETLKAWRQDVSTNAIAISRYHLMKIYRTAVQVGYIYPDQMAAFESLYESYHNLGGNGVITAYREHLLELPSQPEVPPSPGNDWRG